MTSRPEEQQRIGPTPGEWHLDPLHSSLIFVAHYLRFGRVQGTFGQAKGLITVSADPFASTVDVTVRADSVNTGVRARDEHLRSADFLDVDAHPELRFVSTGVTAGGRGEGAFRMYGDLTVHGRTQQTTFDCQWVGEAPHYGDHENGHGHFFTATTLISLSDFGIGDGGALPWGGRLVGDEVDVVLETRVQNQDPEPFLRQIGHG
ncbi:YceI family protein [Nocardiopsis ansamitocini]|uniref:Polyisoprenoid-binding protein n=1 Tax=Nocardiopsis ansamitocini TaxID=1670832 RepID=A0A9W6UIA5_9ACTN|nr:YceI family protein [Nocardiopsis ansamitocini]GLU47479.1 polyisoprenoid-binding protein [Nocardiopsis ansamitocini]